MAKKNLKFWLTCPSCQRRFGISGGTVFKYLSRLLKQLEGEVSGQGQGKEIRKEVPEPPENLPVAKE
jgi:hypothetical protein